MLVFPDKFSCEMHGACEKYFGALVALNDGAFFVIRSIKIDSMTALFRYIDPDIFFICLGHHHL